VFFRFADLYSWRPAGQTALDLVRPHSPTRAAEPSSGPGGAFAPLVAARFPAVGFGRRRCARGRDEWPSLPVWFGRRGPVWGPAARLPGVQLCGDHLLVLHSGRVTDLCLTC